MLLHRTVAEQQDQIWLHTRSRLLICMFRDTAIQRSDSTFRTIKPVSGDHIFKAGKGARGAGCSQTLPGFFLFAIPDILKISTIKSSRNSITSNGAATERIPWNQLHTVSSRETTGLAAPPEVTVDPVWTAVPAAFPAAAEPPPARWATACSCGMRLAAGPG